MGRAPAATTDALALCNRDARPFNWKFTAGDLHALLGRISQREQAAGSHQATLSQAA